jgi:hypothetical protein
MVNLMINRHSDDNGHGAVHLEQSRPFTIKVQHKCRLEAADAGTGARRFVFLLVTCLPSVMALGPDERSMKATASHIARVLPLAEGCESQVTTITGFSRRAPAARPRCSPPSYSSAGSRGSAHRRRRLHRSLQGHPDCDTGAGQLIVRAMSVAVAAVWVVTVAIRVVAARFANPLRLTGVSGSSWSRLWDL